MIAALIGFSVKDFSVLPMGFNIALVAQIFLLAGVLIRKYNVVERTGLKTCAGGLAGNICALIPSVVAKKFGTLPVPEHFCT